MRRPSVDELSPALHARPRRRTFGGREDLLQVYRRAKDFIVAHRLLRICQVDEESPRTVTICNLWRITALEDDSVRLEEFDLQTETWCGVSDASSWPDIPLLPVRAARSLEWWKTVVGAAVAKALMAAGYEDLPEYPADEEPAEGVDFESYFEMVDATPARKLPRRRLRYALIDYYTGGAQQSGDGFVSAESGHAGARALRAALFQRVTAKDLRSALMAMYSEAGFKRYLEVAQHAQGVRRVAAERRNLLPLLPHIHPRQWDRMDLFGRNLWVRGTRRFTTVDRKTFRPAEWAKYQPRLRSFDSRSAFRAMCSMPATVLSAWATEGEYDHGHLAFVASARTAHRPPVVALAFLAGQGPMLRRLMGSRPFERHAGAIERLARIFAAHAEKVWKRDGYRAARAWVKECRRSTFREVADYLVAEGLEAGQPAKNATWESLARLTADWHERVRLAALARAAAEEERRATMRWDSLLPTTAIAGVSFRPLVTAYELAQEGYDMCHCVGDYGDLCLSGRYRVFHVSDDQGLEATLGLWIEGGTATVDQFMGPYNGDVPAVVRPVGAALAGQYTAALAGTRVTQ